MRTRVYSSEMHSAATIPERLTIEHKIWNSGIKHICGIDEVGRGSVAGPVMACAVVFKPDFFHPDVKDSKALTRNKKAALKRILCAEALAWSIGQASEREIDFYNIRIATFMAMRRALSGLSLKPDYVLVDGESLGHESIHVQGFVKGDDRSFTIGAASIIAKEFRDAYMEELAQRFPQYHLEKNKGYGSAEHLKAIEQEGLSPCHRRSFLLKYI